jgi:plastocyanin
VKSLLKKRLPGVLAVGIVAFAVGAAGATATASVPEVTVGASAGSAGAGVSFLLPAQQKARARETRRCRKIRNARKRRVCLNGVARKYKRIAASQRGTTRTVLVGDNFYVPNQLTIKRFDQLRWDWKESFSPEGHNVSLISGPSGVSPFDFESPIRTGPNYRFTRRFLTPGAYKLFCSLHVGMDMDVRVTR